MTVITRELLDQVVYSDELDELLYSQFSDTMMEIDTINFPELHHKIDWMFSDDYLNG